LLDRWKKNTNSQLYTRQNKPKSQAPLTIWQWQWQWRLPVMVDVN